MSENQPTASQEIADIRDRLSWLDEERRKANRRLTELDQKLDMQSREIESRDARIKKLEEQLAVARSRLNATDDMDVQIKQLRKELIGMLERVDQKHVASAGEIDRLRTVERQVTSRELSEIRKELPAITRLQDQIDQRKTDTTRLQQQLSVIQSTFGQVDTRFDKLASAITYTEEIARQLQRQTSKLEASQLELGQRLEQNKDKISSVNLSVGRIEASVQDAARGQVDGQRQIREWLEQARTADYDRTQRVSTWQVEFEQYKQDMQKFHQDYLRMADQANDARVLVQSLEQWRKQIELHQREESELNRVEGQRIRQQWEHFRSENEKFWTKVDVDMNQRQGALDRRIRELSALLHDSSEKIAALEIERDTLHRIQVAQADALKRFPRLWIEEVDKAIANDPNRRRSAAPGPIPDEY